MHLQGVGETLRGTLNSTVDDRFPRQNANKAAAAQTKNATVLEKGRNEMQHIPHRNQQPVSPIPGNGGGYTHQQGLGQGYTHQPGPNESYNHQPALGENYTDPPGVGGGYQHQPTTDTHRGSLPPDPNTNLKGSAADGSHSAVFGLTPDGHRHLDTTPSPTPPQQYADGTNDFSSVSNLTSSSGVPQAGYAPPPGAPVRADSGTAPESVSGNVERIPTVRHAAPGTNQAAATGEEVVSPVSPEGGIKKQGTLSKLFKRKPVGGPGPATERTTMDGDRKKYY